MAFSNNFVPFTLSQSPTIFITTHALTTATILRTLFSRRAFTVKYSVNVSSLELEKIRWYLQFMTWYGVPLAILSFALVNDIQYFALLVIVWSVCFPIFCVLKWVTLRFDLKERIILSPLFMLTICNAQWQRMSAPLLPYAEYYMACGVYDNSIFLIGGWITETEVMEYKIATNEMVDHGASQYSPSTYGIENVGFYFQLNSILYIQQANTGMFYKTDMASNQFWKTGVSIPRPMGLSRQCVTGNDQYLVISGGFPASTSVYVMFLSDNTWINGTLMQNA
eukprot:198991_1